MKNEKYLLGYKSIGIPDVSGRYGLVVDDNKGLPKR